MCLQIILHNPPTTEIPKALPITDIQYGKETHIKSDFAWKAKMIKKNKNNNPATPQLPFASEKRPMKTDFEFLDLPLLCTTRGESMLKQL